MRFKLLCFFVLTVLVGLGPSLGARGSTAKEKIVGNVIAYDYLNNLAYLTTFMRVVLIVRLEPTRNGRSRFIQVAYSYYPPNKESDGGFPRRLIDRSWKWEFRLTRDRTCDSIVEKFAPWRDIDKADNRRAIPIWRPIPGAENETIPFGQTLPCYQLASEDFKAYQH
jgi:hypothetical protein